MENIHSGTKLGDQHSALHKASSSILPYYIATVRQSFNKTSLLFCAHLLEDVQCSNSTVTFRSDNASRVFDLMYERNMSKERQLSS